MVPISILVILVIEVKVGFGIAARQYNQQPRQGWGRSLAMRSLPLIGLKTKQYYWRNIQADVNSLSTQWMGGHWMTTFIGY